ncbi:nitroreductase family protein [Rhodohalobacter sp. 614A]|uniref:nitroreductase family protein n=1 Tax=Rhodohalobacter sp. 614A TaxID=2908649 RepID=UPI001F25D6F5|nr:nitroreductase family protein [Rhodohalobacter sp. 614A]
MPKPEFIPLPGYRQFPPEEMKRRAADFYEEIKKRRTVRDFSDQPVPVEVIQDAIKAAGTAPNGANLQPWHFVVVSDPAVKRKIRIEAEKAEKEFYNEKAPEEWLNALEPLGTDENKPYLETAPCLIVIFSKNYEETETGEKIQHYYVKESVGIATGILITALHHSGLATLTHTPNPMKFLNKVLDRPSNERAYLILVTGHPAENAKVPDITKKPLEEIATFV